MKSLMTIFNSFSNWNHLTKTIFLLCILTVQNLLAQNSCLSDKDAGVNPTNIAALDDEYNNPSPYTFRHMMGVNDAGQFQGIEDSEVNPISYLTPNMRAFHAMDYDFNFNLQFGSSYESLVKPKDTDGFPPNIQDVRNYTNFTGIQGMTNISVATEILNKGGNLTWKEKIWEESDWYNLTPGMNITDGIRQSFQNYTESFIEVHAPSTGNRLIGSYEVGNELWDYPFKEDYHAMLEGAYNAFVDEYGNNTANWKMKLLPGSFNAASAVNTCGTALRNFSNCGSQAGSSAYYQMGDYLDVNNCDLLSSLYAINTHAYPFDEGTLSFVHPEKENNEFLTFKAAVAFRDANPVFAGKGVWLTETGYDSYNVAGSCNGNAPAGVGELSHAAMLLRIFLITSRYHIERINFYMGFDVNKVDNIYHGCTYSSSGFWKLGTHPQYGYASARPSHGASPKPAFFAFSNFLDKFNDKVFTEALVENENVYAYILANPDGSDPYMVFWNPTATDDSNALNSVNVNQLVALPSGYKVSTNLATPFSTTGNSITAPFAPSSANPFTAVSGTSVGSTTITQIKRMPSFIKLTQDNNSNCAGPRSSETGCGVTVELDGLNVNFESTTHSTNLIIVVRDTTWSVAKYLCNDYNAGTDCNRNSSITLPFDGNFIVDVQIQGSNGCAFPISINSSEAARNGGTDNDGDGICSVDDCDDTNASVGIRQSPGTLCDDGNSGTINDQIGADGCTCSGVVSGNMVTNCGTTFEIDGLNVNFVSTVNTTELIVLVRTNNWQIAEYICNDYTAGSECKGSSLVTMPFPEDYSVDLQIAGSEGCTFPLTLSDASGNADNRTCEPNLNLVEPHNASSIFSASSTISSSAEVNTNVSYYANDEIGLNNGFKTNPVYNFSVGIYGCD